jgi:CO dehydrogenase/acetyl-CoA synthase beta subunit
VFSHAAGREKPMVGPHAEDEEEEEEEEKEEDEKVSPSVGRAPFMKSFLLSSSLRKKKERKTIFASPKKEQRAVSRSIL